LKKSIEWFGGRGGGEGGKTREGRKGLAETKRTEHTQKKISLKKPFKLKKRDHSIHRSDPRRK